MSFAGIISVLRPTIMKMRHSIFNFKTPELHASLQNRAALTLIDHMPYAYKGNDAKHFDYSLPTISAVMDISVALVQALILAAGRGVRMGPRGQSIPKGFIRVGDEALITRSLSLLACAGIRHATIVTGHLSELYDTLGPVRGISVATLHNPLFAEKGSFESLRVGLTAMGGPFLLLESDIIYEPRALHSVLSCEHESVILTSGPTGAGDEVYVWADERNGTARFRGMSKQRTDYADAPFGELVGISKISAHLARQLTVNAGEAQPDADYESAVVRAAVDNPIACLRVNDLLWAEIDDEAMLTRVESMLWPRLKTSS